MHKLLFSLLLSLASYAAWTQQHPQQLASLVCECLQQKPKPVEQAALTQCLEGAMAAYLQQHDSLSLTAAVMENLTLAVQQELQKECSTAQAQKSLYQASYTPSANAKALKYYRQGNQYLSQQNYKKSISKHIKAVKADPNFVMALDHLAIAYRKLGYYDEAIRWYELSLAVKPDGHLALMNLAVLHGLKGDYEKALLRYQELLNQYPENPEGYFGLGRIKLVMEEYAAALPYLMKAHQMYVSRNHPYHKDSEELIASLYLEMEKKGEAELFKKLAKEAGLEMKEME